MQNRLRQRAGERGATLIELVITAVFFFFMLIGITSASHLYYTHNALVEATRRGTRYALFQCSQYDTACLNRAGLTSTEQVDRIKNVVLTNNSAGGGTPEVPGLTAANIIVEHSQYDVATATGINYGVGQGEVTVRITNFQYTLVLPGISYSFRLPEYRTTLTGECAGYRPPNI